MRSSTIPPDSFVRSVYCASPSASLSTSFERTDCRNACAGRAVDVDLAHVRDVECAGVGPDRLVLRDHALVLHGHLVAGERHHARTERDVARIQRRAQERRFHGHRL